MIVDIKNCDIKNVDSILNNGLRPSVGTASKLVGDASNVSVSKGGKGIIGIINSFIYKFSRELKTSEIPEEYRKYFLEISDFELSNSISRDVACKAMARKLKDEVYFRVQLDEDEIAQAQIGGLTRYDVSLPMGIDKSKVDIITDSNETVLSAYDVARFVYERAKNIDVIRNMHEDFFYMFEMREQDNSLESKDGDER